MRRYLTILVSFSVVFSCLAHFDSSVFAGTEGKADVRAQVGKYSLSLHGFASPNASITIKSNNILVSTGNADSKGTFSFTGLPINDSAAAFCFESTDSRRLGTSEGCMTIEPTSDDIVLSDIYLPPTVGLERTTITEGSSGLTYGYSMPDASVIIQVEDGGTHQVQSDNSGRYSYTIANLAVGSYKLASKGEYNGIHSLDPRSGTVLTVLTSSTAFINEASELRRTAMLWGAIAALIVLPVLFYLIHRYRPGWLKFLSNNKLLSLLPKRKGRELHHAWFVGY